MCVCARVEVRPKNAMNIVPREKWKECRIQKLNGSVWMGIQLQIRLKLSRNTLGAVGRTNVRVQQVSNVSFLLLARLNMVSMKIIGFGRRNE